LDLFWGIGCDLVAPEHLGQLFKAVQRDLLGHGSSLLWNSEFVIHTAGGSGRSAETSRSGRSGLGGKRVRRSAGPSSPGSSRMGTRMSMPGACCSASPTSCSVSAASTSSVL